MSRTLTGEVKLDKPFSVEESTPVEEINSALVDDALVEAFTTKGTKNQDGSYTATVPFSTTLHLKGPFGVLMPVQFAGELIGTLGPEVADKS